MNTWIVNDKLTCIPGTKTFWHMLLEIEGTVDKTGRPFPTLAESIEGCTDPCDLIIRNGTFFRWMNKDCKTISLIQDRYVNDAVQRDCMRMSDHTVFNTNYTRDKYLEDGVPIREYSVIPLGVNEELFKPIPKLFENKRKRGIFVGDYNSTKNTAEFHQICRSRDDLDFIYVSKLGNSINLPNVMNVRGGADEVRMAELYNMSDFCVMCSPTETLHLASIEAALCDVPVVGTRTGWLSSNFGDSAGVIVDDRSWNLAINQVLGMDFEPRKHILERTPFTWKACRTSWQSLITQVLTKK
jgi:glycosyltransferase involved in cell wall biosynthesis